MRADPARGSGARPKMRRFALAGCLATLMGCAFGTSWPSDDASREGDFQRLWHAYEHCRSSTDLAALLGDLQRLKDEAGLLVVEAEDSQDGVAWPLRLAVHPPAPEARLAVDPRALRVSCTLRAAEVALEGGHRRLAGRLFLSAWLEASRPEHRFYAAQARLGLDRILPRQFPSLSALCRLAEIDEDESIDVGDLPHASLDGGGTARAGPAVAFLQPVRALAGCRGPLQAPSPVVSTTAGPTARP